VNFSDVSAGQNVGVRQKRWNSDTAAAVPISQQASPDGNALPDGGVRSALNRAAAAHQEPEDQNEQQ
jgi:hypothetical protein